MGKPSLIKLGSAALLAVSIVLLSLHILRVGSLDVREEWIRTLAIGEEPADIAVDKEVYVVTTRTTGLKGIALYRLTDRGEVLWKKTWNPPKGVEAYPLSVKSLGGEIIVSVLNATKTSAYILSYTVEGVLRRATEIPASPLSLLFDVDVYIDGTIVIGGLEYTVEHKSQYYVARIDPGSKATYWNRVWGTDDYEYVVDVAVSPRGLIYAIGNTSRGGTTLTCLNGGGEEVWTTPLGLLEPIAIDFSRNGEQVYLLARSIDTYRVVELSAVLGTPSRVIELEKPSSLESITPLDLEVVDEANTLVVAGYGERGGAIEALVLVYDLDSDELVRVIRVTANHQASFFLRIESWNNRLYAVGVAGTGTIVACYTVERVQVDALSIATLAVVALIALTTLVKASRK